MLEAYMNEFESKTHGAKEFSRVGYQNPIETLANMQHYGLPTNLLDWSENALSALFFALSDEKCENTTQDACVYLLNPAKMNLARSVRVYVPVMGLF